MVAKGHHFPGVEVAAVVDADAGLAFPDFRSEERTFQLVTQLAGRSGRDAPGRVIVQTFQPDATPFAYAVRHDVAGFLARELARREELAYPPFSHLVSLVVSGPDPGDVSRALRELRGALDAPEARLLGPGAAPPPPWSPSRSAAGEDGLAAGVREPCRSRARARRAGDASRRPERRRRRRSAVAVTGLAETAMSVSANCGWHCVAIHRQLHRNDKETPMRRVGLGVGADRRSRSGVDGARRLPVRTSKPVDRQEPAPEARGAAPGWRTTSGRTASGTDKTVTFIKNTTYGWHNTKRGGSDYLETYAPWPGTFKAHCVAHSWFWGSCNVR